MSRNPWHATINIAGLGLGLAAVFLIGLWVQYHYSFDKQHKKSTHLFEVITHNADEKGSVQTSRGAAYEVMAEANRQIGDIINMTRLVANWRWPSEQCFKIADDKPCIYSKGIFTDSAFFEMFDFEILSGAANPLSQPRSLAISKSLSQKLYGDADPVGKIYKIDNYLEVTITAVLADVPPTSSLQFDFVTGLDVVHTLWMGQAFTEEKIKTWSYITYLELADTKANGVIDIINKQPIMEKYKAAKIDLQPLLDKHLIANFDNGAPVGGLVDYLRMFILFAGFILLVSAVNFINLATAKATIRSKEIGVRKVTGASKWGIMGQFMIEALLKVLSATFLAVLIVHYTLPILNSVIGEQMEMVLNTEIFIALFATVLLCTILAGAYPAIVMSRFNPIKALKNKEGLNARTIGLRKSLTVFQIMVSIAIVLVTVVIYRQLNFIQNQHLGYDKEGIVMLEPTYAHQKNFDSFKNGLLENHLIKAIGVSNSNILQAEYTTNEFKWSGKSEFDKTFFKAIGIDDGMIEVLGLELKQGTGFNAEDTLSQVLVTEEAVKAMGLIDPVGTLLNFYGDMAVIVGVVNNVNTESLHNERMPLLFYQIKQQQSSTFYIRYDQQQTEEAIVAIATQYNEFEKFFTMKYKLIDEEYDKQYKAEAVMSQLATMVMFISIFISLIGIIGLSTYNVLRRYKEIGIRKVFGASVAQIASLLSKEFVIMSLVANVLAWPLAFWISDQWLSGFAYRIAVPYELFGVCLIATMILIALLVGFQAIKAALMNPTTVIHEE